MYISLFHFISFTWHAICNRILMLSWLLMLSLLQNCSKDFPENLICMLASLPEPDEAPEARLKPFINLLSFCLFFFPPGPVAKYESKCSFGKISSTLVVACDELLNTWWSWSTLGVHSRSSHNLNHFKSKSWDIILDLIDIILCNSFILSLPLLLSYISPHQVPHNCLIFQISFSGLGFFSLRNRIKLKQQTWKWNEMKRDWNKILLIVLCLIVYCFNIDQP